MSFRERTKPVSQLKPYPPSNLTIDACNVWSAWCQMGDKEVTREAATKGTYTTLAVTFLSERQNCSFEEAQRWFIKEVLTWVGDLLKGRQIHKSTHILSNVGLDPVVEITRIFCNTMNKDLREFLGNHLLSLNSVDEDLVNSWALFNNIRKDPYYSNLLQAETSSLTLSYVHSKSTEWKSAVSCDLFFKSSDFALEPFLNPHTLWKTLLEKHRTHIIMLWINVRHSRKRYEFEDPSLEPILIDKLRKIFAQFKITSDMIEMVKNTKDDRVECDLILDELGKFGIFAESESNLCDVLRRLMNTKNFENVEEILQHPHKTLKLEDFNLLLLEHCLERGLYTLINYFFCTGKITLGNIKSAHLEIIRDIKETCENYDENTCRNMLKVGKFLSNDNLFKYFNDNPIMLLAALVIERSQARDLKAMLLSDQLTFYDVDIGAQMICALLKNLPLVQSILERIKAHNKEESFTFYEILQKQVSLDTEGVFYFQLNKERGAPHFLCEDLMGKYGYKKCIDHISYVKECRPILASLHFFIGQIQKTGTTILEYSASRELEGKLLRVAIKNFANEGVTSSCIAFLELVGVPSEDVRMYVKIANIIYSKNWYSQKEVTCMLSNVITNPEEVAYALENNMMRSVNLHEESSGAEVAEALKCNDILVKFARLHNLPLPEAFLRYCTENNWWVLFLIFIQIHNYPVGHCRRIMENFADPQLIEHLSHCIVANVEPEEDLLKPKDTRAAYLARLGLHKQGEPEITWSATSQNSASSTATNADTLFEEDYYPAKTNLLLVLIKAHNAADPPKALLQASLIYRCPVLAILAASYEPDSLLTYWLTWLVVSCDIAELYPNVEALSISARSVLQILADCLKNKCYRTLLHSFQIFLPDHSLSIFVEFLVSCVNLEFDRNKSAELLATFDRRTKSLNANDIIVEDDAELTFLTNRTWIENVAVTLIGMTLEYNLHSRHSQIKFLKHLSDVHMKSYLKNCPDFEAVLNLLQTVAQIENKCFSLNLSVIFNRDEYVAEVAGLSKELVKMCMFDKALEVARHGGIGPDFILIKKWEYEISTSPYEDVENFWDVCNQDLLRNGMSAKSAVHFFLDQFINPLTLEEKYKILQITQRWVRKHYHRKFSEIEWNVWNIYFELRNKEDVACEKPVDAGSSFLYTIMCDDLNVLFADDKDANYGFSIAVTPRHLQTAMEELLNSTDIWQALKLEKTFNFSHPDLDILKICFQLAENIILPGQLTPEQRLLLHGRRRYVSDRSNKPPPEEDISVVTSPDAAAAVDFFRDGNNESAQSVLETIRAFTHCLNNGVAIGQRIFRTYRISCNIKKDYREVVEAEDPFNLLKEALDADCANKLEVVTDFIWVFQWNREKVSDFVSEQVIVAVCECTKYDKETVALWDLELNENFNLIYQAIPDNCSLLGYKLYTYANTLLKIETECVVRHEIKNFIPIIELLIRAHDCFSNDCNMEGITLVLKKCHPTIAILVALQDWKHIVRLLTGIGRYTEMTYIFQILQENKQFEYLLKKGSNKDGPLKTALLNFLKKNAPDDDEMYRMVALHFTLFSEVALIWEKEAESIIGNLITIAKLEMQAGNTNPEDALCVFLTATDETKLLVQKAMQYYTHAAEYHIHGDKLSKAMNAARQAELCALQTCLLNRDFGISILQMSTRQIQYMLQTTLSFQQLLIIVEAYNFKVNWDLVLFEQYIVMERTDFLKDFLRALPLTDTLVCDISQRFSMYDIRASKARANMRALVEKLVSVHTKYKVASELGFNDITEEILEGEQLAYLKDTVWKKGYQEDNS